MIPVSFKTALRLTLFILLLAALLLPAFSPARAQAGPVLTAIKVDLWPEYDEPQVLVITNLTLPDTFTLPAPITLRIPPASVINAVAVGQPDGTLINAEFNQVVSGDWLAVTITATTPRVHLEYYDPNLQKDGAQRTFSYTWPGDYAAESFVVQVQQPFGASQMQILPSLGSGLSASDGLTYYTAELGAVAAGEEFTLSVAYQKPDDTLSISEINPQPSQPLGSSSAGRMNLNSVLPWILAGLGLVLILGGGWFYWQSGREPVTLKTPRRGRRRTSTAGPEVQPEAAGNLYCHNCGKRAGKGDRFCRTCGTPLRSS